eukprot:73222-Rhodomonas_salina.1
MRNGARGAMVSSTEVGSSTLYWDRVRYGVLRSGMAYWDRAYGDRERGTEMGFWYQELASDLRLRLIALGPAFIK